MPVRPARWPDGTRPSSDTSLATLVAVVAACALHTHREHELYAVGGTDRHRGVHGVIGRTAVYGAQRVAVTCRVKGTLSGGR